MRRWRAGLCGSRWIANSCEYCHFTANIAVSENSNAPAAEGRGAFVELLLELLEVDDEQLPGVGSGSVVGLFSVFSSEDLEFDPGFCLGPGLGALGHLGEQRLQAPSHTGGIDHLALGERCLIVEQFDPGTDPRIVGA